MTKRQIWLTSVLLLALLPPLSAVPARPGRYMMKQPDGSTVTLIRHGDEFLHWTTMADGKTVVARNRDGFYRPSVRPDREALGGRKAADQEAAVLRARRSARRSGRTDARTARYPVVLVQFSDRPFTVESPLEAFSAMLNQAGYSANGATGSVRDYYLDNSMGLFQAEFDVFGPYTYDGTVAANAEEQDAAKILWASIAAHDDEIDWSQYDNGGDGKVDRVFMYYAGWNEAEGEDDTIWPHKSTFTAAGTYPSELDGMQFSIYACASERSGNSYVDRGMCGIGTAAHEFAHTLGLPDFYDTNGSEDGEAGATYDYDIMCSGNYNNEGRTPPYFTAEERVMIGWMDGLTPLPGVGEMTLGPLEANVAYRLSTANTTGDGEYFIFECRSGRGWDRYVEPGLLVYHADKSTSNSVTVTYLFYNRQMSPYEIWTGDPTYINVSGSHPCLYVVPAADPASLLYTGASERIPFPGAGHVTTFTPTDWAGRDYDLFNDIAFVPAGTFQGETMPVVTLVREKNYRGLSGIVRNSAGDALEGASVQVFLPGAPASQQAPRGPLRISGRTGDDVYASTETGADGRFLIDLSEVTAPQVEVEVSAPGCISQYVTVTLKESVLTRLEFRLAGLDDPVSYTLKKYDLSAGLSAIGTCNTSPSNIMAGIRLDAAQLAPYVGRKIRKLGFAFAFDPETASVDGVYGVIDFGTERKLLRKVAAPSLERGWNIVDVSADGLVIPEGVACHFGYVLEGSTFGFPFLYTTNGWKEGGFEYDMQDSSSSSWRYSSSWKQRPGYGNLVVYVELEDGAAITVPTIANPGYGTYAVGDRIALSLLGAEGAEAPAGDISWSYDDEPVAGGEVLLRYAGPHVLEARYVTVSGLARVVELEIEVQ